MSRKNKSDKQVFIFRFSIIVTIIGAILAIWGIIAPLPYSFSFENGIHFIQKIPETQLRERNKIDVLREISSCLLLLYGISYFSHFTINKQENLNSRIKSLLSVTVPFTCSLIILSVYTSFGISWLAKTSDSSWQNFYSPLGTITASLVAVTGTITAAYVVFLNGDEQRLFDQSIEDSKLALETSDRLSTRFHSITSPRKDKPYTSGEVLSIIALYNDWIEFGQTFKRKQKISQIHLQNCVREIFSKTPTNDNRPSLELAVVEIFNNQISDRPKKLSGLNFSKLDFHGIKFTGQDLNNSAFHESKLKEIVSIQCDWSNIKVNNKTLLHYSNFTESKINIPNEIEKMVKFDYSFGSYIATGTPLVSTNQNTVTPHKFNYSFSTLHKATQIIKYSDFIFINCIFEIDSPKISFSKCTFINCNFYFKNPPDTRDNLSVIFTESKLERCTIKYNAKPAPFRIRLNRSRIDNSRNLEESTRNEIISQFRNHIQGLSLPILLSKNLENPYSKIGYDRTLYSLHSQNKLDVLMKMLQQNKIKNLKNYEIVDILALNFTDRTVPGKVTECTFIDNFYRTGIYIEEYGTSANKINNRYHYF